MTTLSGRSTECAALERLVASARAGQSRVLVLRGEAGVGKTALLEYFIECASGCRVARASGVESEMEFAFAGLHQLCSPMLGGLGRLPEPQADALSTAFGLRDGPAPDLFLVGLAVLSLLSDATGERPLVCVVDDVQWLDRASLQALAFVARRLAAEPIAMAFAMRDSGGEQDLSGLTQLVVRGLNDREARALLGSVIRACLL
jgi:predicted ATPase